MFKDRVDAGRQLASLLRDYSGKDTVVYALPRGGLVLGAEIARELHCPLDFFVVKKIGHPAQEEFAIGAVAENGQTLLDPGESAQLSPDWLKQATKNKLADAKSRRLLYSGQAPMISPTGKTAIIVDDGIATGITMMLALREIKKLKPRLLVCAVPVLPSEVADNLEQLADKLIYLEIPEYFLPAVGAYYHNFDQVEDQEALEYLKKANI